MKRGSFAVIKSSLALVFISWIQPVLLASPLGDPHEQHLFTVAPTPGEVPRSEMVVFPAEAAYAENLDQFLRETIEYQLERLWNTAVPEKARRQVEKAQEKASLQQRVQTSNMEFKSEFDWSQFEYVTIIDFRKLKLEARYGITNDETEIIIEIPGFEGGEISFVNLRGEQSVMLKYETQL